jgi:hypothetical protein
MEVAEKAEIARFRASVVIMEYELPCLSEDFVTFLFQSKKPATMRA